MRETEIKKSKNISKYMWATFAGNNEKNKELCAKTTESDKVWQNLSRVFTLG